MEKIVKAKRVRTKADKAVPNNPFNALAYAQKGDATARDIFAAVGYALSCWEHCETSFATLYTAFVKPTGGNHIAFAAYGRVNSSVTRRDMIYTSAEVYFALFPNEQLSKNVKDLLSVYGDADARRNNIAHAVVMSEPVTPTNLKPNYYLVPSFHASAKREPFNFNVKYRYDRAELDLFSRHVKDLDSRALKLTQAVREAYQALPLELREQFP